LTGYLVDVNVLIALADEDHIHYNLATRWLDSIGDQHWGPCAFSEAGFLRIKANPALSPYSIKDAGKVLRDLTHHANYRYWAINDDWETLTAPFRERVFGHQQITDACHLGLAIKEGAILVTMDKGIQFLAGAAYKDHVLVLE
jgi:toxin-antitoxin system PIN domain toxin